jgi:hypothetical protein
MEAQIVWPREYLARNSPIRQVVLASQDIFMYGCWTVFGSQSLVRRTSTERTLFTPSSTVHVLLSALRPLQPAGSSALTGTRHWCLDRVGGYTRDGYC